MVQFEVSIRRYDRKEGHSNWTVTKVAASSQVAALASAAREFSRGLTRIQKRDCSKLLEARCVRLIAEDGAE